MGKIIKEIDGRPVTDAKRPIMLHITEEDIKNSSAKQPNACAAARAICRQLHAVETRVHLSRVYVKTSKRGLWTRYFVPKSLRAEIVAFDRGGRFQPGYFTLSLPPPSVVLGRRTGTEAKLKKRKVKKTRRPSRILSDVRIGPA